VVASSGSALSYQWRFNGTNLAGATAASLTLTNLQPSHAGNYDVRVSNTSGSVTSLVAVLTVRTTQPPIQPTIITPRLTSGVFSAVLSGGNTNRNYYIEVSVNLTNWVQLVTVFNATGQVSFSDTNVPPPGTLRAYRARLAP